MTRGIIAGIYTTSSVEACFFYLQSSRAQIVVVDNDEQLEKVLAVKDKLPDLEIVIQIFSSELKTFDGYWKWSDLENLNTDDVEEEYQRRSASIVPNECCLLVYTSGTVGNPKGVMLSHDNITFNTLSTKLHLKQLEMEKEVFVMHLPMSHIAAQFYEVFLPVSLAATVFFADKDAMKGSLLDTLKKVQPTFFYTVPRIYEKIQEKLLADEVDIQLIRYDEARTKFLKKVKCDIGFSNCKYIMTGAAPLSAEMKQFFLSLDIQLLELYGLSETVGGLISENHESKAPNSVGLKPFPGVKAKIVNADERGQGEICFQGRHIFMGYLNQFDKTVEAIDDDRWLHTGDQGCIDENGYVSITGRIKELIITSAGENIPFIVIENRIKAECLAISNAFLVGDKRKFLIVLLTLRTSSNADGAPTDNLAPQTIKWLESLDIKHQTLTEVLGSGPDQKVINAIQGVIDCVNSQAMSRPQKIRKFAILPHDFSLATGELGPTLKLNRKFVLDKHREVIEKLYN